VFPFRYGRRNSMELDLQLIGFVNPFSGFELVPDRNSGTTQWTRNIFEGQALGLLVPVGWALLLYTSGLSTQCSAGGLTRLPGGKPHLETCFPLRCFQRLSLPNVANQPCSWQNNWHTRGSSIPVLSY
jgi:hypothetical protein